MHRRDKERSASVDGGHPAVDEELFPLLKPSSPIVIDVRLEEKFTPIILKHAPRFRDTRLRTLVWKTIVDDSRGRYIDPNEAQNWTLWLCRTAANPHDFHFQQTTPALRKMLLEIYNHWNASQAAKTGRRRGLARRCKKTDTLGPNADSDDYVYYGLQETSNDPLYGQWMQAEERLPQLERPGRRGIDSELDVTLMQIVLKHSRDFQKGRKMTHVYQAIADDSRGQFKNGTSVVVRTRRLCKIASSPEHPLYHETTPTLRSMLLIFQHHAKGMAVDRDTDELLMDFVLKQRPFAAKKSGQPGIWMQIIERLKNHLVESSSDGMKRIEFLSEVHAKSSHAQHEKLTTTLRRRLKKYARAIAEPPVVIRKPQSRVIAQAFIPKASKQPTTRNEPGATAAVLQDRSTTQAAQPVFYDTRSHNHEHHQGQQFLEMAVPPSWTTAGVAQDATPQFPPLVGSLTHEVAKLKQENFELREELHYQREMHHHARDVLEKERRDRSREFATMMATISRLNGASRGEERATNGPARFI